MSCMRVDYCRSSSVMPQKNRAPSKRSTVKGRVHSRQARNCRPALPEHSQNTRDMAGKSFAFGDKAALLQRAVVVGSGMPLGKFAEYEFIGHYDNIVHAVMNGDFDAGILKDIMAYNWNGKGIRILYSSPELPAYNITASRHVDDALLARLRDAFLSLDENNPAHVPIIKAVDKKYDGFAPTGDAEYDIVRELIKPFDNRP